MGGGANGLTTTMFLALGIVVMQLTEVYLRYLPFRSSMSTEKIARLSRSIFIGSAVLVAVWSVAFKIFGASAAIFKVLLFLGWLPYFWIARTVIGGRMKAHVFVFGMEALWVLMLHSLTTMLMYFLLRSGATPPIEVLNLHGPVYLSLFGALLGWERRLFENLLPSSVLFDNRFGWYAAILPTVIFLGTSVLMFDGHYPHPAREHLSRLGIPLFFFMMCRSMSISTRQIDERNQREHVNELVNRRLASLREYDLIMQEHQRQLAIFRHDRRHDYRLLSAMIEQGEIKEAIAHIEAQARLLRDK